MAMVHVKFLSYDGAYPNLCTGMLRFSLNGKEYCAKSALISGGSCSFSSKTWEPTIAKGPWEINASWSITIKEIQQSLSEEDFEDFLNQLTDAVNENVPFGCCGGCI